MTKPSLGAGKSSLSIGVQGRCRSCRGGSYGPYRRADGMALVALSAVVQDLAEPACECFRLTGKTAVPSHESAVMAGEDRRLPPEELSQGAGGPVGDRAGGFLADRDDNPRWGRCEGLKVRAIPGHCP